MSNDEQEVAENIVSNLCSLRSVDILELFRYMYDELTVKEKTQFIADFAEENELMTFDQAMEAAADAKSI
jgi:hypothetical protein